MIDNSGFKNAFLKRKISTYQLEKLTGVRTSRLSDINLNKRNWNELKYCQVEALANAINLTVEQFVEEVVNYTTSIPTEQKLKKEE